MLAHSRTAPTPLLLATVAALEARLVEGRARPDEIDLYVRLQLELAERGSFEALPTAGR